MIGFEEIRDFLVEQCSIRKDKIKPHSRLFHDLAIDGDDFDELILGFSTRFKVDLDGVVLDNYWRSEIGAGWRHIIFTVSGERWPRINPFTVQMLIEAANTGNFNHMLLIKSLRPTSEP